MKPFENKVALVTGSSRGIGKAIALELARGGANLIINYRRRTVTAQREGIRTKREIEKLGQKALLVRANIGRPREVDFLFEKIEENFDRIDILVNNAALTIPKKLQEMTEADWNLVLDINIKGTMAATKKALRLMKNKGWIVNISGLGSRVHFVSGYGGLGAAKAALESLTRELQVELEDEGRDIVVNAICPGVVDTTSFWFFQKRGLIEFDYQRCFIKPQQIAKLTAYLCSQDLIRGQVIIADRGMFLRIR